MKLFVLDASVTMAWCFGDEATQYTRDVLTLLQRAEAVVPPLWPFEVSNVIAVALRNRRLNAVEAGRFLDLVAALPIEVDAQRTRHVFEKVLPLAREHGLSSYDAAYLELAVRRDVPIATLDARLKQAAARMGVRPVRTNA